MASSSSSRPAKLQKLNDLRRSCPFVTQAALASLLQKIHQEGLPDIRHAKAMKEATRLQLSSMNAYGPVLLETNVVTTDGTLIPIWIVIFLSLLVGAYQPQGSWANFSTKPIQRTQAVQRNHGLCRFIQMKWFQVIHWHPG
jgi:hypothetical protein